MFWRLLRARDLRKAALSAGETSSLTKSLLALGLSDSSSGEEKSSSFFPRRLLTVVSADFQSSAMPLSMSQAIISSPEKEVLLKSDLSLSLSLLSPARPMVGCIIRVAICCSAAGVAPLL